MNIDNKTHKIQGINYNKKEFDKNQIIIDISLRKNDYHINRYKHKDFGKFKGWSTYTISRDNGIIYKHFPAKYYSNFIGDKNVDKHQISIILENMGILEYKDGKFLNVYNELCDNNLVIEKKFMGGRYWELINDDQLNSLSMLCENLIDDFNIESNTIMFQHYNKTSSKFKGILFKTNYFDEHSGYHPQLENIIKK